MQRIPFSGTLESGVLLIHKPSGWTSFDVVKFLGSQLSRRLGKRVKVGHAGTLDPLAEGLMVLASGPQTKNLHALMAEDKEYEALLCLGETTPSHDRETPVVAQNEVPSFSLSHIEKIVSGFLGQQLQIPPAYSALKIQGRRAYQLAREGEVLKLEPRQVMIYDLRVTHWEAPWLKLTVRCSKGTYIRSLARDIGEAAGTGAVLHHLLRTRSGRFFLKDAVQVEELKRYFERL